MRGSMDIEEFRDYCLSFAGVDEKMPFTDIKSDKDRDLLVFYVLDKWFCLVTLDCFDFCNLKCDPEEAKDLRDRYEGVKPGYHMNKKHWISVCFNMDVPDDEIKNLVKRSYELVVSKLPRAKREMLLCGVNGDVNYVK